jgi:hypothetical protein
MKDNGKYLFLPKEIWHVWPQIVEKNRLNVEISDEDNGIFTSAEGQAFPYCSGGIEWNGLTAGVVAQRFVDDVGFILGTNASSSQPLFEAILRIFFASGAKYDVEYSYYHCGQIYTMPLESQKDCLSAVQTMSGTKVAYDQSIYTKKDWKQSPDFVRVFEQKNVAVAVFAGVGYDADKNDYNGYIALNNQSRRPFLMHQTRKLFARIGTVLASSGAMQRDMLENRAR